jgi:hypothetical protein
MSQVQPEGRRDNYVITNLCSKIQKLSLRGRANQCINLPSPRLQEGAKRVVTERWRGLRWTLRREVLAPGETFAAYGEVVWSWRRDPGVKLLVRPMQ